jgi:hypothetical protein
MAGMPEILIPPKLALRILRDACCVKEEGEAALQARVRQLIEMGVTGLTRETAHARHRYGLTELAQLALAMVLMNAQMPPAVAAKVVREGWDTLVPFILAGVGDLLPDRFRRLRPIAGGPFAIIEGNALAELGRKSVRSARGGRMPTIRIFASSQAALQHAAGSDSGTYVSSTRFMAALYELFIVHAEAPEDVWNSVTRLRQSERCFA